MVRQNFFSFGELMLFHLYCITVNVSELVWMMYILYRHGHYQTYLRSIICRWCFLRCPLTVTLQLHWLKFWDSNLVNFFFRSVLFINNWWPNLHGWHHQRMDSTRLCLKYIPNEWPNVLQNRFILKTKLLHRWRIKGCTFTRQLFTYLDDLT